MPRPQIHWFTAAFAVVSLLAGTHSAEAIYAPAPLEVLIDQADLIVAGKVTAVAAGGFAIQNRPQDVAVIDVLRVLKSLPGNGQPKVIKVAQPAANRLAVSTDLSYRVGQEGIWMLQRDAVNGVYTVSHPSQYQPKDQWKPLSQLVAAREKITGGEPVEGLIARTDIITTEPQPGRYIYEVRLSLQNTTDKPITTCTYVGHKPLNVEWIGPDGKKHASVHYDWLQRARLAGVRETNFVTIPPSGVRYVGPNSPESGIFFQSIPGRPNGAMNSAVAGEHRVNITFVNPVDGKDLGLKEVWTGQVAANPAIFTVK